MWFIMAQEQRAYDLSDRLIRAISGWNYELNEDDVEDLLAQGAEVNRLHGTLMPLHCASMAGDIELVQLLLEHGAEVNRTDGYGRGSVHYAAECNSDCLELLLSNGADPDALDSNQDTPLHWAAFKNNSSSISVLLHHGANVNALDYNGDSPICWAAMKGNLDCLKILLDYNARPDIINYDKKNPISRICSLIAAGLDSCSENECLELLLKAMGQFDLRDTDGSLPEHIAADNKLSEMLTPCCNTPRQLQQLSRFTIRQHLGRCFIPNVTCNLPLPDSLKQYILLEE